MHEVICSTLRWGDMEIERNCSKLACIDLSLEKFLYGL